MFKNMVAAQITHIEPHELYAPVEDRIVQNSDVKKWIFKDRSGIKYLQILTPTFTEIDSFSEFD